MGGFMVQVTKILNAKQLPRLVVSAAVLGMYGLNPDPYLQTLVSAVVFYWIGSSAGSFNKDERTNNASPRSD